MDCKIALRASSTVRQFEDLIAWQRARELTKFIYTLTMLEPFCRDFGLCSQIQRAAVSVMSNIAEGFERSGKAEFHHFLAIAKASCAEVRSQLYVALDIGYLSKEQFQKAQDLSIETSRIIQGLQASLNHKRKT